MSLHAWRFVPAHAAHARLTGLLSRPIEKTVLPALVAFYFEPIMYPMDRLALDCRVGMRYSITWLPLPPYHSFHLCKSALVTTMQPFFPSPLAVNG